jgi:hypothetical protein
MRTIHPRATRVPGRLGRGLTAIAAAGLGLLPATCGPRKGAPAASTSAGSLPGGPAPPRSGLGFPSLVSEWSPPMLAAGDPDGLAAALRRHPQVTLALGPRLAGTTWERRAAGLVAALSPGTRVGGAVHAGLGEVVEPATELATARRGASTAEGRPTYTAALSLRAQAVGAAGPLLALDDAAIDLPAWQALASSSVGSCEPAMQALAAGQELALTQLAPFLDHADAQLAAAYRAGLRGFVPEAARSLARHAGAGPSEAAACGRAYQVHVQRYAACVTDARAACPGTPRLVLVGGARIVAEEPALAVAEGCPGLVGRDYAAELRGVADAAAESAAAGLGRGWTILADRLGTLTEVHAALEEVCVPRRRRFAAGDLAEARSRLGRIGAALASDELGAQGRWIVGGEPVAVPGLGRLRTLAAFAPGTNSLNTEIVAEARALREFVLARGVCRAGPAAGPLAAVVASPGGGVEFYGLFFEEELVCGSLPPLAD